MELLKEKFELARAQLNTKNIQKEASSNRHQTSLMNPNLVDK